MALRDVFFALVAFAIVGASLWYEIESDRRARESLSVEFARVQQPQQHVDPGQRPIPLAVCYLNVGMEVEDLIATKESSCFKMEYGLRMNTYENHEFYVASWDSPKSTDLFEPRIVTIERGLTTIQLGREAPAAARTQWRWKSELKKHSETVATAIGVVMLAIILATPARAKSKNAAAKDNKLSYQDCFGPAVPRSTLKAYAVVTMLMQHFALLFIPESTDKTLKLLLTLPADIGGSAVVFCFLAGLTIPDVSRWGEAVIVGAYLLLQVLCPLPSPMSYETLLTIVGMRLLFRTPFFRISKREEKGATTLSSPFGRANIVWHGILCAAVVQMYDICSGNILKIFNSTMTVAAVGGHLLLQGASVHRIALWILPSVVLKAFDASLRVDCDGSSTAFVTLCQAFGAFMALALLFQFFLQCVPKKQPWWQSSRLSKWLASKSLEIYVMHLFLMKGTLLLKDNYST